MPPDFYWKEIASELINCFRIDKGITLLVMSDRNIVLDQSFGILSEIRVNEQFHD